MIETIDLGPSTRDLYIKALRSGVESYMMNVSGRSLERVRIDRKRWLSGYDVFAPEQPESTTGIVHERTRRGNSRPLSVYDRRFCEQVKARMDAIGLTGVQLAREAGVSISMISDTRNQICPISPSSRRKIRRALDKAEYLHGVFAAGEVTEEAA